MPVRMLPEPPPDRRMAALNTILRQHKPHGTWYAYVRGCRCDECQGVARQYQRRIGARVQRAFVPWPRRREIYLREKGAA